MAPGSLVLRNARAPAALIAGAPAGADGWARVDLRIGRGAIASIAPAGSEAPIAGDVDAANGILLPALVDCHAHLDKAHLADRRAFPEYGLLEAIAAMEELKAEWTEPDLLRRADFALRTAFAQGVRAIRSHVDWRASTPPFVWPALSRLRADWAGRIELQLSPLIPIDEADDPRLTLGAVAAARGGGGVIGFFVYRQEPLKPRLGRAIDLATAHDLDLDFHIDEGLDPALTGLHILAGLLVERRFPNRVLCGHAVSLSLLPAPRLAETLDRVRAAGVTICTLPHTNLFLQERNPARSPVRRGMAPIREIAAAGIPVAIATDNVRDGFYPFGAHDPLEALALAAHAAQLPDAARLWAHAITATPARAMGLAWDGVIRPGAPADLVLFDGRTTSELLATQGRPRRVLRAGRFIDAALPSLRELDR